MSCNTAAIRAAASPWLILPHCGLFRVLAWVRRPAAAMEREGSANVGARGSDGRCHCRRSSARCGRRRQRDNCAAHRTRCRFHGEMSREIDTRQGIGGLVSAPRRQGPSTRDGTCTRRPMSPCRRVSLCPGVRQPRARALTHSILGRASLWYGNGTYRFPDIAAASNQAPSFFRYMWRCWRSRANPGSAESTSHCGVATS